MTGTRCSLRGWGGYCLIVAGAVAVAVLCLSLILIVAPDLVRLLEALRLVLVL